MKKEERTFSQLVKEVIDNAKQQARNQWNENEFRQNKTIDRNANIADEWLRGSNRQTNRYY